MADQITDEELLDLSKRSMIEQMHRRGEFLAEFLLDGPEGRTLVAAPNLGDPEAKPMIYAKVRDLIAEQQATRYVVMMEAWGTAYEAGEEMLVEPRKSDRRVEVLYCLVVTRESTLAWTGQIMRDDNGGFAGVENERTIGRKAGHGGMAARLFDG